MASQLNEDCSVGPKLPSLRERQKFPTSSSVEKVSDGKLPSLVRPSGDASIRVDWRMDKNTARSDATTPLISSDEITLIEGPLDTVKLYDVTIMNHMSIAKWQEILTAEITPRYCRHLLPFKEGKFGAVWAFDGSNSYSQTRHVSKTTTNS